jgi:hypothetical protein
MNTNGLTPNEVNKILKTNFNCRIKQVPITNKDYVIITKKRKKINHIFYLFNVNSNEKYNYNLYFENTYILTISNGDYYTYNKESRIQTAYDFDTNTVYWRYVL